MKSIRVVLCMLICLPGIVTVYGCSALAQAQGAKTGATASNSKSIIDNQVKSLTEKLSLTPNQQDQIRSVLEEQQQQTQAVMQGNTLSRDDKLSNAGHVQQVTNSKIRDLLTDEQKAKFDQMEKDRGSRSKQENSSGAASSQ